MPKVGNADRKENHAYGTAGADGVDEVTKPTLEIFAGTASELAASVKPKSDVSKFNRSTHAAICTCGRPGCPIGFMSQNGGLYATQACRDYVRKNRPPDYVKREPRYKKAAMVAADLTKLSGDRYCLRCGRYTPHEKDTCRECGRENVWHN